MLHSLSTESPIDMDSASKYSKTRNFMSSCVTSHFYSLIICISLLLFLMLSLWYIEVRMGSAELPTIPFLPELLCFLPELLSFLPELLSFLPELLRFSLHITVLRFFFIKYFFFFSIIFFFLFLFFLIIIIIFFTYRTSNNCPKMVI